MTHMVLFLGTLLHTRAREEDSKKSLTIRHASWFGHDATR